MNNHEKKEKKPDNRKTYTNGWSKPSWNTALVGKRKRNRNKCGR